MADPRSRGGGREGVGVLLFFRDVFERSIEEARAAEATLDLSARRLRNGLWREKDDRVDVKVMVSSDGTANIRENVVDFAGAELARYFLEDDETFCVSSSIENAAPPPGSSAALLRATVYSMS